ncbi:MAG: hypothetical protein K2X63_08590, partial [Burkholderiaceae bacterium]|nr:hypothetical protein [Burkholderiaceae bacterium]
MKCNDKFLLSSVALAVTTLFNQAHAQATNPPAETSAVAAKDAKGGVPEEIKQVVVTGNASKNGLRKIDASYSITTANEEQLKQAAP